jgi:hypothetical protein
MKTHGAVGAGGEDAFGEQGVGMAVEVEQRAEALHERDGTAVRVGDAVGPRRSPASCAEVLHDRVALLI